MVRQELLATGQVLHYKPQRWTREKKDPTAEMDYLLPFPGNIVAVDGICGATGTLRSLLLLIDILPHRFAVRLSADALKKDTIQTPLGKPVLIMNLPYFLQEKLKIILNGGWRKLSHYFSLVILL